jgi:hypothetical protein
MENSIAPCFASSTTIGDRLPRFARNDIQCLFMSLRGAERRSNLLPYSFKTCEMRYYTQEITTQILAQTKEILEWIKEQF